MPVFASVGFCQSRIPMPGQCPPIPLQEILKHSQASLAQSPMGSLLFSPGFWYTYGFVCALQEPLFPPVLWKLCNHILLSFKVRFP